jgi:hypothetical protein
VLMFVAMLLAWRTTQPLTAPGTTEPA